MAIPNGHGTTVTPYLASFAGRLPDSFHVHPLLRYLWHNDPDAWTHQRLYAALQELGFRVERPMVRYVVEGPGPLTAIRRV